MTGAAKRIAMWSGPRNLSTAMMYSFAALAIAYRDEPFYEGCLEYTGIDHPMRGEIIAAHRPDWDGCLNLQACAQAITVFYQKHMTLHMILDFDRRWMRSCINVLIRHPAW